MESISVCAVKWRAIPCAWQSLIGLGYRHLSMNGRSVARAKYLLRRIDYAEAENLAQRSLEAQLATGSPSGCLYGASRHGRADSRRL